MKLAALLAFVFLFAQGANAAGTMSNVHQEIDVGGAQISSSPSSSLAADVKTFGSAKIARKPGLTIGKLANEGGHVSGINQELNFRNTRINADGGVNVGQMGGN